MNDRSHGDYHIVFSPFKSTHSHFYRKRSTSGVFACCGISITAGSENRPPALKEDPQDVGSEALHECISANISPCSKVLSLMLGNFLFMQCMTTANKIILRFPSANLAPSLSPTVYSFGGLMSNLQTIRFMNRNARRPKKVCDGTSIEMEVLRTISLTSTFLHT